MIKSQLSPFAKQNPFISIKIYGLKNDLLAKKIGIETEIIDLACHETKFICTC